MSERDDREAHDERDDELAEALRRSLQAGGPSEGPSAERVAAVRAAAEQARRARAVAVTDATVAEVHRLPGTMRRRQFLVGGAAAATGAVVGAAAVLATDDEDGADPPPTEPIELAAVADGLSVSDAYLINHTWGVELNVVVAGLAAGQAYAVRYRTTADEVVGAGSMVGIGAEPVTCRLNGAVLRDQTRAIEVVDADDSVVLRADLA